jgi:ATP-dependent DNA ligase
VIDGEAVVLGVDGVADFNALHSRKHDDEVQLYAFDILALDGDDLRKLPLSMRKTNLARILARRPDGIFVAPFEQGEIGPELFRAACRMGLEGLVSKRRNRPYQAGRSKHWVKVKNRSQSTSAFACTTDSSRTSRHVRKVHKERTRFAGARRARRRWRRSSDGVR